MINTDKAPKAIGPYSQAISVNNMVFVSGQLPLLGTNGVLVEGGIKEQTHKAMQNLQQILEAAGTSISKVIKTTVFLSDLNDFSLFNDVYEQYFSEIYPARSCIQVAGIPKNALIEIEAIALI